MFIKIKLESSTETAAVNKLNSNSYFEIAEESTIGQVKLSIEKYIDVPAERLEIRTITQALNNDKILTDIDELIKRDGSAVMLYIKGAGAPDEEPTFFCFLQFYSADEVAIQKDYEKRAADSGYIASGNPASVSSTITLVDDTEPEYINNFLESNGSSTNSESDSESETSSDTESSVSGIRDRRDEGENRKRRLDAEEKEKQKRIKRRTVIPNIMRSSISTYLEEFPNYSKQIGGDITLTVSVKKNTAESTLQDCSIPRNLELKQKEVNSPNTTTIDPAPCARIMPEIREFIVILASSDGERKIEPTDCIELLASFFNIFKTSENVKDLKFYEKSEPILYNGLLWLACQDEFTYVWTLDKANCLSDKYKSYKFIEYFKLRDCLTVIPRIDKNRNLFDVFDLIEQQNPGIKTAQWTVTSRRDILNDNDEFSEKCISLLCSNELFMLRIDQDSLDLLEKRNFKLNYCFWKIIFEITEINHS